MKIGRNRPATLCGGAGRGYGAGPTLDPSFFFHDFLDFHHFSPSMTVTTRMLLAFALACINCNAPAHSSTSPMYLQPHRTLCFDSRSLLCQTTTNAALLELLERHRSKEKNVTLRFFTTPLLSAKRRGTAPYAFRTHVMDTKIRSIPPLT